MLMNWVLNYVERVRVRPARVDLPGWGDLVPELRGRQEPEIEPPPGVQLTAGQATDSSPSQSHLLGRNV